MQESVAQPQPEEGLGLACRSAPFTAQCGFADCHQRAQLGMLTPAVRAGRERVPAGLGRAAPERAGRGGPPGDRLREGAHLRPRHRRAAGRLSGEAPARPHAVPLPVPGHVIYRLQQGALQGLLADSGILGRDGTVLPCCATSCMWT